MNDLPGHDGQTGLRDRQVVAAGDVRGLLRAAAVAILTLSLIAGLAYPLAVTAVARLVFPRLAAGSLVREDGRILGSDLIGQAFTDPGYFWGRPSATSPYQYNASAGAGTNLGPLNPRLLQDVGARVAALRAADPENTAPLPVDLVTSSGSGLDPHISPAAAHRQVPRVARARGLDEAVLHALVDENTSGRQLGFLGQRRVNVLQVNLALDDLVADG